MNDDYPTSADRDRRLRLALAVCLTIGAGLILEFTLPPGYGEISAFGLILAFYFVILPLVDRL
jgi:hypothetical protein